MRDKPISGVSVDTAMLIRGVEGIIWALDTVALAVLFVHAARDRDRINIADAAKFAQQALDQILDAQKEGNSDERRRTEDR